jgi:hypothetical protein
MDSESVKHVSVYRFLRERTLGKRFNESEIIFMFSDSIEERFFHIGILKLYLSISLVKRRSVVIQHFHFLIQGIRIILTMA